MYMKLAKISKGGQVSIPAQIKSRWATERVIIEDHGDALVLRPLPDDPIAAALSLATSNEGPTTDEIRAQLREEEASAEARRMGRDR
jgi:hypothetical protein